MDPKVLTLFDDEDFQQPPPKPKTGRQGKSRGTGEPENGPDAGLVISDREAIDNISAVNAEEAINEELSPDTHLLENEEADNAVLDVQMRAALIQTDYAQYVYKEMPAQPKQQVRGSGIVFEGVVAPRSEPKARIVEEEVRHQDAEEEENGAQSGVLPEWQLESRYYSIGEVAKLFGVNTSHIRFWTTQFRLKPRTTRKGDRLYNADDINELRLIHHLVKEKKHTIKGAKEKLKDKDKVEINLDLKTSLGKLKDILVEIKDKL